MVLLSFNNLSNLLFNSSLNDFTAIYSRIIHIISSSQKSNRWKWQARRQLSLSVVAISISSVILKLAVSSKVGFRQHQHFMQRLFAILKRRLVQLHQRSSLWLIKYVGTRNKFAFWHNRCNNKHSYLVKTEIKASLQTMQWTQTLRMD